MAFSVKNRQGQTIFPQSICGFCGGWVWAIHSTHRLAKIRMDFCISCDDNFKTLIKVEQWKFKKDK